MSWSNLLAEDPIKLNRKLKAITEHEEVTEMISFNEKETKTQYLERTYWNAGKEKVLVFNSKKEKEDPNKTPIKIITLTEAKEIFKEKGDEDGKSS